MVNLDFIASEKVEKILTVKIFIQRGKWNAKYSIDLVDEKELQNQTKNPIKKGRERKNKVWSNIKSLKIEEFFISK